VAADAGRASRSFSGAVGPARLHSASACPYDMQKFYTIDGPESPWGDYSNILITGMSAHLGRKGGLIQLERTGPYVPPISFPGIGDIVVTDAFREELESSGLIGMEFQPVIKKHIVHLDWHLWDKTADEPQEYPEGGEPGSYILGRPHSSETSKMIGELWEVRLKTVAQVQRSGGPTRILLVASSLSGADLFRAEDVGYIYASANAKSWLEQHVSGHVSFKEVQVV
jgi:hypothetical protein